MNPNCTHIGCKFCKYYDFNNVVLHNGSQVYAGLGFCDFKKQPSDPTDKCNDFVCKICELQIREANET